MDKNQVGMALIGIILSLLLCMTSCESTDTVKIPTSDEIEVNLHVWQEIKKCDEGWGYGLTKQFGAFIGYYSEDAPFWDQKWNITLDTDSGLKIVHSDHVADCDKKGDIAYTYINGQGCNYWYLLSKEFYAPYDYDFAREIEFTVPERVGEYPFRFRFENVDTGEVWFSREFTFRLRRCSETDRECSAYPMHPDWIENHTYIDII